MFNIFKRKPAAQTVLLQYDAARTTRDNASHWSMADGLSADSSMTPETRRTLRNRSRYETANNSYALGLVLTLAEYCIGTGPRLQLLTENEKYNSIVEQEFAAWSETIRLGEKLQTLRKAKCIDGEAFAVMVRNPEVRHPVMIDLRLIECDRVATPFFSLLQKVDGINYDRHGNPVSYDVLTEHPGDSMMMLHSASETVPAEFMIHWFRQDRPEQSRGVPELCSALPLFAELRRYTRAVITAAETAADIAAIIQTPIIDDNSVPKKLEPLDSIALEKGMMTVLTEGATISQLKAEQPTTTYSMFKREILSEIGRCLQVPVNIILGDSSNFNYASGRLDHQTFFKNIRNEQSRCEKTVLFPLLEMWYREAVRIGLLGEYPIPQISAQYARFYWDGTEHVDPVKEVKAAETRIRTRVSNLSIECAKLGQDWEDVLVQAAREQKRITELDLAPPEEPKDEKEDEEGEENKK
jgi:lambda family phage portal protein